MKQNPPSPRRRLDPPAAALWQALQSLCCCVLLFAGQAGAQTLTWDLTPGSPGVQNGSGTWNTTSNNWISGGLNTQWINDPTSVAIFGGGTDAATSYNIDVDLGFGTASGLVFNNSGYVLTADEPQTIVVSSTTASISVAAGKTATIGSNVTITTPTASHRRR